MILKNKKLIFGLTILFAIFSSCVTTEVHAKEKNESEEPIQTFEQIAEQFLKTKITITAKPRETTAGKNFSSAYTIFVSDENGNAKANETVEVFYPAKKTQEAILFYSKKIQTDETGKAQFLPNVPQFACDEKIYFFPEGNFSFADENIKSLSTSAPYRVRSNKMKNGCVVYVFDFDENENVMTNSHYLLRDIVNLGVRAGNAPLASASYLEKSSEELYKATKAITGTSSSFIVAGKITFAEKTKKTDDGNFSCTLQGDIFCIDLENGETVFRTKQIATKTGTTAYKAEDACRNALTKLLAEKIIYGL